MRKPCLAAACRGRGWRRCLDLLAEAAIRGEASRADLAYLTDRVLLAEGQAQVYGTQFVGARDGGCPGAFVILSRLTSGGRPCRSRRWLTTSRRMRWHHRGLAARRGRGAQDRLPRVRLDRDVENGSAWPPGQETSTLIVISTAS